MTVVIALLSILLYSPTVVFYYKTVIVDCVFNELGWRHQSLHSPTVPTCRETNDVIRWLNLFRSQLHCHKPSHASDILQLNVEGLSVASISSVAKSDMTLINHITLVLPKKQTILKTYNFCVCGHEMHSVYQCSVLFISEVRLVFWMVPYLNILGIRSEKPYYTKIPINLSATFNCCTHFPQNWQSALIVQQQVSRNSACLLCTINTITTLFAVGLAPLYCILTYHTQQF